MPKKTEYREQILAKYHFTEKEMAELGAESGRVTAEINRLKEEAKAAASEYKSRTDAREGQRNVISAKLANGYEMRPVEAIVHYFPERKSKIYVHPDTGAIIREEEMTHADWQLPMFSKEEMEKTKAVKPVDTKPEELSQEDREIIEAATSLPNVEIDLDQIAEDGGGPAAVITEFHKAAKHAAMWPFSIANGIAAIAKTKEEQGTGAIIEFLRPFTLSK